MKQFLVILYWIVSVVLVATILTSLGYRFHESIFIGTLFLPGALAAKYFLPKIGLGRKRGWAKDAVFVVAGIILAELFLLFLAHYLISIFRGGLSLPYIRWPEFPPLLTNPVFITLVITVLAVGSYFFESWLDKKMPDKTGQVTFTSGRNPVTLSHEEILYVESNDSVTTVVATDGRRFKNKTPISRWEAILSPRFLRIHRSFLVNKTAVTAIDVDLLYLGDIQLPISRKYKEAVSRAFEAL